MAAKGANRKQRWLGAFVPHRLEMLISPAWQQAPRPLRRLIERLEIEHLRHGGFNNGELYVSYNQFVAFGLSKKSIRPTLDLGQALGLIEVIQDVDVIPGDRKSDLRPENKYRLTYVPAKGKQSPTDEWKAISADRAERLLNRFRQSEEKAPKLPKQVAA
jgi:hypothetical protein